MNRYLAALIRWNYILRDREMPTIVWEPLWQEANKNLDDARTILIWGSRERMESVHAKYRLSFTPPF